MLSEGTAAERERVAVNSISHSHCNQMQQLKREAIHSADDFLLPADVDPHVRGASLVRKRPSSVCRWSADSMSLVTRLMRLRKKKHVQHVTRQSLRVADPWSVSLVVS